MGPAALPIMAVSAVIGAGAAVAGVQESKKQARAQAESADQARASNISSAARERRASVRRARAEQAAIEAAGISAGTTGSSAGLAVGQGVAGQVADNASKTSGELLAIGNQSAQNQIIAQSQARQQTFAAIGNFSGSVAGLAGGAGGMDQLGDMFSTKPSGTWPKGHSGR